MPGDIQLSSAAIVDENDQPAQQTQDPEELENKPLPREQVEAFLFEIREQPAWRKEADKCADYYDGNQLSTETLAILEDRNQPPLISNLIKPTIDTVLGMEARTRTDWKVRPEDDGSVNDDFSDALSLKLKHAEIESRADRACSDAYAAQVKAGLGWVEVAREEDPFKCSYRVKYVHRREIAWDWRAEQSDLSDARYLIRRRWLDLEYAIAMMPQYADLFRMTMNAWSGFDPMIESNTGLARSLEIERDTKLSADDWRDMLRKRVCLYEIWYRKWVKGYVLRLPNGKVIEADFNNPRHNEAIVAGVVQITPATFQKVRLAWYVGPHFLYDIPSPYKHNFFPYVPFFGYREDLTGAPYGLVRAMLSPQDEINARKSKMLWSLNSRRVITDDDAVEDHAQTAEEISRPDAYIILSKNKKPNSQFKVEPGGELAAQQFQVMQESKDEIAQVSGVHKPMMGQQSDATSGIAINSLTEQGLNTLAELNDNYRYARRLVGEMLFELVKESLSQGQQVVKIGEGKNQKIVVLNQPAIDPETGEQIVLNDVQRVKTKVVLDDIPSTPTFRAQQFQLLTEITKSLPENLQGLLIDFVLEASDMPKRQQAVDRIRSALNIQDEDQRNQAAQAQAQEMERLKKQQDQMLALEAAKKAAEIRKINAEADRAEIT